MGAGYVGAGYRERAADFLGACLPLPGAGSSLSSLSRLKVRTGAPPHSHVLPPGSSRPPRAPSGAAGPHVHPARFSRPTRAPTLGSRPLLLVAASCSLSVAAVSCSPTVAQRGLFRAGRSAACGGGVPSRPASGSTQDPFTGALHRFASSRCVGRWAHRLHRTALPRFLILPFTARIEIQTSHETLGQGRCPGRDGRRLRVLAF